MRPGSDNIINAGYKLCDSPLDMSDAFWSALLNGLGGGGRTIFRNSSGRVVSLTTLNDRRIVGKMCDALATVAVAFSRNFSC